MVPQAFAGTFGIFSVVGIKGRNDVGVVRRKRDVRFFSIKRQEGELGSWWHNTRRSDKGLLVNQIGAESSRLTDPVVGCPIGFS